LRQKDENAKYGVPRHVNTFHRQKHFPLDPVTEMYFFILRILILDKSIKFI